MVKGNPNVIQGTLASGNTIISASNYKQEDAEVDVGNVDNGY